MDAIKDLDYWKQNCEKNYIKTPIGVLKYITELEQALQLLQPVIIKSVCNRVNNFENNRCINCGAKAGHKCELQTVL